jgi:hypothetical protein
VTAAEDSGLDDTRVDERRWSAGKGGGRGVVARRHGRVRRRGRAVDGAPCIVGVGVVGRAVSVRRGLVREWLTLPPALRRVRLLVLVRLGLVLMRDMRRRQLLVQVLIGVVLVLRMSVGVGVLMLVLIRQGTVRVWRGIRR